MTMHARRSLLLILLADCCTLGACRPPHAGAAEGSPPITRARVGPLPGPGEPPSRPNPLDQEPSSIQAGRRLFVQFNCSGCHGGRAGGGMGPSLRDADWLYGSDAEHIFGSITDGRAHGMPSWSQRLSDQQIWQLTAYIQSLRTDAEPEAPR
jgi:cytochrome c oxidase cbb3-type subunit 3